AEKTAILTEYDSYKIEKTKEIENLTEKLNVINSVMSRPTKPCCDVDVIALQNDKISIICNNLLKSESDNLKHVQTIQRQTNIIKELSEKIEKYSTVVSISKPKGNLMSPQPNNLQKTILFLQRKINRLENKLKSSSNQNCDACKSESVDTQIDLSSNPSMNNYDNSDDSMYKMIANEEEKIEAKYCSLCADLSIDIGNKNKLISEYQNILVMKDKEIERIGQKFKNILLEKQHEISYLNGKLINSQPPCCTSYKKTEMDIFHWVDLESSNNRPNKTLHIKQQDFQDKLKYLKIKNELMKKQLDQYTVKNLIKKDSLSTEIIEEGAKMNYLKKLILSYFTTDNIDQKSVFSKVIVQILNVSDSEKDSYMKETTELKEGNENKIEGEPKVEGKNVNNEENSWNWSNIWQTACDKSSETINIIRKDFLDIKSTISEDANSLGKYVKENATTENATAAGNAVKSGVTKFLGTVSRALVILPDSEDDEDFQEMEYDQIYARFLINLATSQNTFLENIPSNPIYDAWVLTFDINCVADNIEQLLATQQQLSKNYIKLVPKVMDRETFWTRYFYKRYVGGEELKNAIAIKKQKIKPDIHIQSNQPTVPNIQDAGKTQSLKDNDNNDTPSPRPEPDGSNTDDWDRFSSEDIR
ncbi:hypothetical protein A3Q56_06188, partial [Intoshia linei]